MMEQGEQYIVQVKGSLCNGLRSALGMRAREVKRTGWATQDTKFMTSPMASPLTSPIFSFNLAVADFFKGEVA
jgi:hypothetical protein